MIVLQEIAKLLNEERLRHRDLSLDPWSSSDKVGEYFRALLADSFDDEDQAAQHFYESDRKSTAYQKLKAKLKRILQGRLFLLDFQKSEETDRQRAYMECHRSWAAIKILIAKHKRDAAVRMAKQLLRLTQKYEFTDLTVNILRFLRAHYGIQEGNLYVYEQYKELFLKYTNILQLEDWAEGVYTDLTNQYVYRRGMEEEVMERAKAAYDEIQPVMKENSSYRLHISGIMIGLHYHLGRNDYATTIGFCEKGISFFEDKPYQAQVPLQLLYQQLVVCYTQLRQFDQAANAAEEGLNYLSVGSFNWFKHQEQRFLLYMHTTQYESAYKLWEQTTKEKSFRRAPEQLTEMWLVFQAYLYYLASIGELEISQEMRESFRLGRFINQTPRYSKDKKGMNIPILIIQILFMIDQNRRSEVIDRIEAIEKYCSRYLKKGDMLRSNCFIKMLLQIPIAHFHKAAVNRKADKYWQRLQANPIDLSHQAHEIEIIPYEKLWGFVQDRLSEKFYRPRKRKSSSESTIEQVGER